MLVFVVLLVRGSAGQRQWPFGRRQVVVGKRQRRWKASLLSHWEYAKAEINQQAA